jgi:hypothetical protein
MEAATHSLKPLAVAARVHCNKLQLEQLRSTVKLPSHVHIVQLALGTLLSAPLRPAMPDPSPHPLKYGWIFESAPLSDAGAASVRLHSPQHLSEETA